jgi:hypothetical protein
VKKINLFILCNFCLVCNGWSQNQMIKAFRTQEKIHIDARLNETDWNHAQIATNFTVYEPNFGSPASQVTEVKVLYDDKAIYIAAYMYDSNPQEILSELTRRDVDDGNTDMFMLSINPNNDGINTYEFLLTAANVQTDIRISDGNEDYNWDAIWESETAFYPDGWVAEIRIPFSSIRFPKSDVQSWSVNFWRKIRRVREISSWQAVDKDKGKDSEQMGVLSELNDLNPPLRLSLFPYISGSVIHEGETNSWSNSFNGGMDLKLGISESYTLDLTLIPDFSQIKSDNQELNLTPFETYYDEHRPFFTEGTELFERADLFYSRRIGKIPEKYDDVRQLASEGYQINHNPRYSKLINAVKISGRGKNNLAVGFLNAVTANTFASVTDSLGNSYEILTEAWANYNILVLDQSFKNNSFLNLTNTRVDRPDKLYHANVLGSAWRWMEGGNQFGFFGNSAWSNIQDSVEGNDSLSNAYRIYAGLGKLNGEWQYNYSIRVLSEFYNQNDLGYLPENNEIGHALNVSNYQNQAFGKFNKMRNNLSVSFNQLYRDFAFTNADITFSSYAETKQYLSIWNNLNLDVGQSYDYYEARVNGRFFVQNAEYSEDVFFSTDYRKTLALDTRIGMMSDFISQKLIYGSVFVRARLNNRAIMYFGSDFDLHSNDIGFYSLNMDKVVFTKRNVNTIVPNLSMDYVFTNTMYLSLNLRHYWRKVNYLSFYYLQDDGHLGPGISQIAVSHINFNTFNVDLMYSWNFAPGSFLNITWKYEIFADEDIPLSARFPSYSENIRSLFQMNAGNALMIRLIYYLDYHQLFHS